MAYIGRNPAIGTQKVLDSLESQFNGTLTTFDLRYNTNTIYPPIASALIVSLGGVLQEPGVAYTVASDTITFASAPPTGADCWILLYTEFGGAAGATANLTVSNNLTIGNELHGPANFVIDPATIGDNTGTVEIKGNLTVQGTQTTVNSTTVDLDHLSLGDNEVANFGDSNDLQIYHDGSNSYVNDTGTGGLQVRTSALILRSNVGENMAFAYSNGAVELFHNNSRKFETASTGVTVTGLLNIPGTGNTSGIKLEDLGFFAFDSANDDAAGSPTFYNLNSNSKTVLRVIPNGTGQSNFEFFANDYFANTTSWNNFRIVANDSLDYIRIDTSAHVSGDEKDLSIETKVTPSGTSSNQYQLYLKASDGNIGVGTNSPDEKLHIQGGSLKLNAISNLVFGAAGATGVALRDETNILGGSLDGSLGAVTMSYLPSAPSSPVQGQFYFNSLNQKAQIYTGSSFVDLVPSGGGGGGGGGGTTDAQATFRKYTYTLTSTTNAISGSSDAVITAGDFVVGNVYTIKTVGTTNFTAIGASANTVGVQFTATGAGTGTGDAYDTLYYSTGGIQNIEVYVNGVKAVEGATNDYVATTGTSVNFIANLASGDVVDIQVYELLTNDAYVLASGGTFTGNVGINTSTINNRLHIHSDANEQGILLTQGGDNYSAIISDANRSSTNQHLLALEGHWNGTPVAEISLRVGSDTTNKDDGIITFRTSSANNLNTSERMRIDSAGNVGIGTANPLNSLHVRANDATLLMLERDGTANAGIRYENDTSQMFAGLSSNASFFGIGTSENIGSAASQLVVMRATGNVGIGTTNPSNKLSVHGTGTVASFGNLNTGVVDQIDIIATAGYPTLQCPSSADTLQIASLGNVQIAIDSNNNSTQHFRIVHGGKDAGGSEIFKIDEAGNFKVSQAVAGWTNSTSHPILMWDFKSGVGDMMYMASGGNTAIADQMALVISDAHGFKVGRSGWDGSDADISSSNEYFRITTAGDVGVGTNNPQGNLHISSGTSGDCKLILEADTDNNAEGDNSFIIFKLDGGFENSVVWAGNADGGNDNSLNLSNAVSSNGGIRFFTSSTDGGWESAPERMRIAPSGSVGIGTANPGNGLGAAASPSLSVYNGSGARLGLWGNGSRWWYIHGEDSNALQIGARTSSNTVDSDYLTIGTTGNVGIGTPSPAYKLEVEGDIKVGELGTLWFSDTTGSIEKIESTGGTLNLYSDADIHFYESDANVRRFTVDVNNGQLDFGSNLDTTAAQVHFDYHENSWINGSNVGIGTTDPTQKLEVKGGSIFIRDDNYLITNRIRCGDGAQELILTAGESSAYIGQSPSSQYPPAMGGEHVYLVAESGLVVYSSSGNWVNTGSVRRTGAFCDSNGNGSLPGTLSEGSDIRLKTNIRTIPNALETVKSLRGAIFNRVDKDNKEEIGLIAQEVEEVLPQVVEESEYTWEDEKMKSIGYGKMVGLLIEAVKEQQAMIDELRQEITELKNS